MVLRRVRDVRLGGARKRALVEHLQDGGATLLPINWTLHFGSAV